MGKVVAGALLACVALAALLGGASVLAVVVIAVAAVTLVDASLLLARAGARPVLAVAAIPGVLLPVVVAFDPARGWARIPAAFVAALLLGCTLLLVFGRRRGVVAGLGATALVSLVVGLGAASIVLLRALPDGFRWILALLVLVLVADLAAPLVAMVRRRRGDRDAAADPHEQVLAMPLDAVLPGILVVAVAAAALGLLLDPPLTWPTIALLAVVSLIAALGGSYLQRALSVEAGVGPSSRRRGFKPGVFTGLVDALLLAAPAAYVIARSAVL
jgi:hypothetical protein